MKLRLYELLCKKPKKSPGTSIQDVQTELGQFIYYKIITSYLVI